MSRLVGNWVRSGYNAFERWRNYKNSRRQADDYRKTITESKPNPFVGNKIIKRAKEESAARYGDPGHWHWLALYAELKEEYKEGWMPGDLYTYKFIPYLNPRRLAYLSTFKSYDHQVFTSFASEPVAVVVNGAYYSAAGEPVSLDRLLDLIHQRGGEVVVKEDAAPSGKGIRFMKSAEINPDDFESGKSYLVQPLFKQHQVLQEMYSKSINTIRISTYLDRRGDTSIKHTLLRVGHGGSRIVNWGDEDIDLYIDRSGQVIEDAQDGIGRKIENLHPDNGYPLREIVVPSMGKAIDACLRAHHKFPYLRFIAWDLYIDQQGEPRMIEWNAVNPSFWVHEARLGPFWTTEEIDEAM